MRTDIEITWPGQPNLEKACVHKLQWQKNNPVVLILQN